MNLTVLDHFSPHLLRCASHEIHHILPQPTLIHLQGRQQRPLFVSVLLHGNETTGWSAVQRMLQHYAGTELPRALSIFIGNVTAARAGVRRLEGQPDYNRIWEPSDLPESRLMMQVVEEMRRRQVCLSIDIHNNTGNNPHYGCVNTLDAGSLQLARQFSSTVIYFCKPTGVQSMAMGKLCPAAVVECGLSYDGDSVAHASEFLLRCLNLSLPLPQKIPDDIDLLHLTARIKLPESIRCHFGENVSGDYDLLWRNDLEQLNFKKVPPKTRLATVKLQSNAKPLIIEMESGESEFDQYFQLRDGGLYTTRHIIPVMLTPDVHIMRQDCVCYLMEHVEIAA